MYTKSSINKIEALNIMNNRVDIKTLLVIYIKKIYFKYCKQYIDLLLLYIIQIYLR